MWQIPSSKEARLDREKLRKKYAISLLLSLFVLLIAIIAIIWSIVLALTKQPSNTGIRPVTNPGDIPTPPATTHRPITRETTRETTRKATESNQDRANDTLRQNNVIAIVSVFSVLGGLIFFGLLFRGFMIYNHTTPNLTPRVAPDRDIIVPANSNPNETLVVYQEPPIRTNTKIGSTGKVVIGAGTFGVLESSLNRLFGRDPKGNTSESLVEPNNTPKSTSRRGSRTKPPKPGTPNYNEFMNELTTPTPASIGLMDEFKAEFNVFYDYVTDSVNTATTGVNRDLLEELDKLRNDLKIISPEEQIERAYYAESIHNSKSEIARSNAALEEAQNGWINRFRLFLGALVPRMFESFPTLPGQLIAMFALAGSGTVFMNRGHLVHAFGRDPGMVAQLGRHRVDDALREMAKGGITKE